MRARATMPATSKASSGDKVHCTASMLAMMTSAICSTGIALVPRMRRLSNSSSRPQTAPSRNEPLTRYIALVAVAIGSLPGAAATTCQTFSASIASTLLTAVIISSRSVT